MISVIIPTYNCAEYLEKCLISLSKQTYKDFEVIVVDDGSTDATAQVVENFTVDYIYQPHNNANVARNLGYRNADKNRPYVVFCDSDCVYNKNFLKRLLRALEDNADAPFAYGNFYVKGEYDYGHRAGEYDHDRMLSDNFIDTSALIRKDYFPEFDENLRRLQDWDLWLSIVLYETAEKPVYVDEFLYDNIKRKDSITNKENYTKAKEYIIKKHNLYGKI